jgi:hypothetical protein
MARLSLTFIAALFFLKSFASGEELSGYAWFNNNAGPNDCNVSDADIVDETVEVALESAGVTEVSSYMVVAASNGGGRSLLGDGRELEHCTTECYLS